MFKELPSGWNLVTINDVFDVIRGISFPKSARTEEAEEYVGCLRTANVQRIVEWDDLWKVPASYLPSEDKLVKENDIIISTANSLNLLGKSAMVTSVPVPSTFGTFVVNLRAKTDNPKYLYYFLQSHMFLEQVAQQASTTTNISNISTTKLKRLLVPIPSILEQNSIVSRIEELFSELDNGVETLRKTKQQLAVYRQAVLKRAFEGVYTVQWRNDNKMDIPLSDYNCIRKENPTYKDTSGDENEICLEIPAQWLKVRMGDVFEVEVGATPSRRIAEYWNGDISWVSSGEVHFNSISDTKECVTQEGLDHASTNVQPIGTIMLAMIGEGKTRGQAAILNIPAAHNQNTAAILVSKTPCQPKYIYYFLQMNYDNTRRVGSGNNQKALNKERVRALRFPFTSFAEQAEIVREIEARLSVCDSIEKTVDTALQQAEAMRQSILKQAFEGKVK